MTIVPKYKNHNGYLIASGFPEDQFDSALQYQAQPNDLFVTSYPKCGTTLTQHIVYLLLTKGTPIQPNEKLDRIFPHLEEVGGQYVQDHAKIVQGYRLIKTHFDYDRTPQNPQAKYIFVVRNPKDCVVSFFHHTKGFPQHYDFADGEFSTYFDLFLQGQVDHGDYFDVVRSWMDHRKDENVLCITYEALRANLPEMVQRMAHFLQVDDVDQDIMQAIQHHSSLSSMKKDPLRWCSARDSQFTPFVRSGKVAGWKELLSLDQVEHLDTKTKDVFTQEELRFLGPQYF